MFFLQCTFCLLMKPMIINNNITQYFRRTFPMTKMTVPINELQQNILYMFKYVFNQYF